MFPMTVTVHNRAQLDVVLQAISQTNEYAKEKAIHAEPDAPEPKGKKPGAAKAADKSSNTTSEAETSADTAASPSDEPVAVEDVNKAIINLAKANGRDAAVAVLKEFGVSKVPELKAEQYPAVLAAAMAALEGGQ